MPSPLTPHSRFAEWDIFCTVVDNYGDIGVCWRLARQLAAEHGCAVRLWVDALEAFAQLCPQVDARREQQRVDGVDVRRWPAAAADFPAVRPGDVVVEAFACQLPERFIVAMAEMAGRDRQPIWINLDYLSAESWVEGCHALPSPHPRLPLTKYFFFPGFTDKTGGLLREQGLAETRQRFLASDQEQSRFWQRIGQPPPEPQDADALRVSLFAYENAALADLLAVWAAGDAPVCCFAPVTRTLPAIEAFAGRRLRAGDVVRSGHLEIRLLPFVTQDDYDRLLWSCDLNFVRGEDSFVRAQWAAQPFVWHIYPQDDDAHRVKLAAFLDRYCHDLPSEAAATLRALHDAWNAGSATGESGESGESCNFAAPARIDAELWARWRTALPELRRHSGDWAKVLSKQQDLCTCLFRFCLSKL